jgi:hypothetical protein
MPPIPPIPMIPELGQTKLDFTGQHRAKRPGKLSNPEARIPLQRSIGSRNWISRESAHEASLARSFEDACIIRYDDDASVSPTKRRMGIGLNIGLESAKTTKAEPCK